MASRIISYAVIETTCDGCGAVRETDQGRLEGWGRVQAQAYVAGLAAENHAQSIDLCPECRETERYAWLFAPAYAVRSDG